MAEAYYQSHILEHTAKTLSGKFSRALAHLLSPNDQTMAGAAPDRLFPAESSPSHTEEENPSAVARVFTEAFVRALKLKQELLLSRSQYKLVFFGPGEMFDPDRMMRDGEGYRAFAPGRDWPRQRTQAKEDGGGLERRVKLCLFPALYARGEKELPGEYGVGVSVRNCLVDCDNFITGDANDVVDGMFSLVVKGVVLV
jgi:hypothetical protein